MFCPRLRDDLVRLPEDDGPGSLHDPVFDRRIDLGPATSALVGLVDGRPGDEVLATLEPAHGPRARIERMLRRFMLLGLVEGTAVDTRARLAAIRRGEARLAHTVLEGARFACQGSAACCQGHRLGPLSDDDIAGLRALGHADKVVELARDDDSRARYLRQVDGRCVFLRDDHRCDLHARHGGQAKPGMCRLYPIERIATVEGIKLYDRGSCATLALSARSGPPLTEQLAGLRAVLPNPPPFYHPVVRFDDGLLCDYSHLLALSRAGIALVERHLAGAGATLAALFRLVTALRSAFADFPFAEGEPERTRDALLASDPGHLFQDHPPGLRQEGAEMLSVIAADLEEHARSETVIAAFGERFAAAMAATMETVKRATIRISETGVGPPIDEARDALLRLSLRQQLFSPRALVADRPIAGLLRMAILVSAATHAGLSAGHSLAARLLDLGSAQAVLVQHEELAETIFAGMPLVLGA